MSISHLDIEIPHVINYRYFYDDKCIRHIRFSGIGDLLVAENHNVGDYVQITTVEAQYTKETLTQKREKEINEKINKSPFADSVKAFAFYSKPGFFATVAHNIKEEMKERNSRVNVTRIYQVISSVQDLNALEKSEKNVIFYLDLTKEYIG